MVRYGFDEDNFTEPVPDYYRDKPRKRNEESDFLKTRVFEKQHEQEVPSIGEIPTYKVGNKQYRKDLKGRRILDNTSISMLSEFLDPSEALALCSANKTANKNYSVCLDVNYWKRAIEKLDVPYWNRDLKTAQELMHEYKKSLLVKERAFIVINFFNRSARIAFKISDFTTRAIIKSAGQLQDLEFISDSEVISREQIDWQTAHKLIYRIVYQLGPGASIHNPKFNMLLRRDLQSMDLNYLKKHAPFKGADQQNKQELIDAYLRWYDRDLNYFPIYRN